MTPFSIDPLDGLELRPLEAQVAVLANEVRNQRNSLDGALSELRAVKRAMYGLLISLVLATVTFALTLYAARPR